MPDLVARLSGLHSTLTSRLTLQERLLSLSGRLELVLSQVELRSGVAPTPLPSRSKNAKKLGKEKEISKYVEGDSSDEEQVEEEQMEVEIEEGDEDDDDSIEDIELGGGSDEDEEDEDEDESDDEDDDDEENNLNGFIDDEAEEDYEEDESDEDSD